MRSSRPTRSSFPPLPARRTRAVLVALVMATLAIAGCADQTTDRTTDEGTPEPPLTDTERRLAAERTDPVERPDRYDSDDWFLLSAPRAPDGHVRAFHWRLPPGAVQEADANVPLATLLMEIVPVQDAFAPGEDWALLAFHDDNGEARLVFALLGPTLTEENLTSDPPTEAERAPPATGGVLLYPKSGLEAGDDMYFVLSAHGTTGETAFALRTVRGNPQSPPAAAPSFDAFVATEPESPHVPTPVWDGTGDYMAYYGEEYLSDDHRRRVWTENIEHESERYDPDAGGRAARLSVASTAQTGNAWSLAFSRHQANTASVWWSIDVATQGVGRQANGVSANDPVGATGAVLARANGVPRALFMADGEGESRIRFTVEGAAGDLGELTAVQHHRLPATLEEMLGIPSMTVEDLYQGDAGGLPWVGPLPSG